MSMLHRFQSGIDGIALPQKFTYPFCYTPHPLCVLAVEEVQAYLKAQAEWQEELAQGKMFGVLVVQTVEGGVGYLTAFSGILAGSNCHPFFVPPIYDLLQPDGFFKQEEEQISDINRRIDNLRANDDYRTIKVRLSALQQASEAALTQLKEEMRQAKSLRNERRKADLSEAEVEDLVRESQFQKAEYKRQALFWQEQIEAVLAERDVYEVEIDRLRSERRQRSAALQQQLFGAFRLRNGRGETQGLYDTFYQAVHRMPPAGTGECCAPKLLQYAYLQGWKPLAMAEFWWGASPKMEIREHGHYYPVCRGKCEPLLGYMLQGLDVEESPIQLGLQKASNQEVEILYEDEWLLVINKPAGILTIPDKERNFSIYELMCRRYPNHHSPFIVHRLDMATSGLLVISKNREVHARLQKQFAERTVKKRYIALLDGELPAIGSEGGFPDKGTLSLPLCLDPLDRPRQIVSTEYGKEAITDYEVLERKNGQTRIAFYPRTGRTHQLRVHAAHPDGLHCPIVGDDLYGHKAERLYLHAEALEFVHPITEKRMRFSKKSDF